MTADSLDLDGCFGMKLIDSYKKGREKGNIQLECKNIKSQSKGKQVTSVREVLATGYSISSGRC